MKLRLPSSYLDLKLKHLQVLETTDDPVKRVQAVTGMSFAEIRQLPHPMILQASEHIDQLMREEVSAHLKVITLDGVEYGFIPNWEEFSAGEWIDMETYTTDFWATAHKAMSILYRPIDRRMGKTYTIKPYTAKEDAEVFKEMPAPLVAGALLFFWTTERKLLSDLKSSLIRTTKEAVSLLRSGDGTPSSSNWLARTYSKWMRSRAYRLATPSPTSPSSKTSPSSVSKNTSNA